MELGRLNDQFPGIELNSWVLNDSWANQESQDAKPFVEQMGMDKAFAESHACDVDTEEEPDGTCVWYMQRHFGYGEELRRITQEKIKWVCEDDKM